VKDLLEMLRARYLKIGVLYLDKGFSGGPVVEYLRRSRQSALDLLR